MLKHCFVFGGLTTSLLLAGCMKTRVVSVNQQGAVPVTQSFVASDKIDILLTVDGSQLTPDQQRQVEDSVTQILIELDRKGVDYHIGLVGAGAPVGGLPLPGFGRGNDAEWIALGLGALTTLGNGQRFLETGAGRELRDELLDRVLDGVQNELGSRTRGQFERDILPLLPVVIRAAQGGAQKQDVEEILRSVAPVVMSAVRNGQLGGNYNEAIRAIVPIIELAAGSGAQKQDFDRIVASLLPVAINIGMKSPGGSSYVAVASVVLPAVLELSDKAKRGAKFQDLLGTLIPIVLAQTGNSGSRDYLKMIGIVGPLVTKTLEGLGRGKVDPRELLGSLLPTALAAIGKEGASDEYTYLLSAVMPVVLTLVQDESLAKDPDQILKTVSHLGLATVLSALDQVKLGQGGVNEGFLRDDAVLSILMIGEQLAGGKQDPKMLAETFVKGLLNDMLGTKEKLVFDAILGGDVDICSSQIVKESNVYKEIAVLTGGRVANLCNNPQNIGDILSSSILSKLTEYQLDRAALETTVRVFLDGVAVPQSSQNGWSLSVDGKFIKLNGSYIPSARSEIAVQYVPQS